MKPRVFIGSSSERLELAYAIQANLDHDADTTVWAQDVFKLSQSSLDSLIAAVNKSDFAIFVFYPDDVTQIRDNSVLTVRDNLIFELGLFMGKLGKERVFYLIPRSIQHLHLPTDLLGITAGTYDDAREDRNIQASIGTFCTQIRQSLKGFVMEHIEGVSNEVESVKKIVLEKPKGWEFLFIAALMRDRLIYLNKAYDELAANLYIQRAKRYSGSAFFEWYQDSLNNFEHLIPIFSNVISELDKSSGPPGVAGKTIEMKNAVDRVIQLCKELLNWEYELNTIYPPEELLPVKELLKGVSKMFIDEVNKLPSLTEKAVMNAISNGHNDAKITIVPKFPERIQEVMPYFTNYFESNSYSREPTSS